MEKRRLETWGKLNSLSDNATIEIIEKTAESMCHELISKMLDKKVMPLKFKAFLSKRENTIDSMKNITMGLRSDGIYIGSSWNNFWRSLWQDIKDWYYIRFSR